MRDAVELLLHAHLAGQLMLGMLGCALLLAFALVAAAATWRADAGARLRAIVWAEAACLGPALALAGALVTAGRRRMLAVTPPRNGSFFEFGNRAGHEWFAGVVQVEAALRVAGTALSAIAVLSALAAAVWSVRAPADPVRAVARGFAALLLAAMAVGMTRHARAATDWSPHCWRNSSWCIEDRRAASSPALAQARIHVVALAAVGAIVLAGAGLSRRRRDEDRRRGAVLGAVVLCALGAFALRATRSMAADAGLPVPEAPPGGRCPTQENDAQALPPAVRCERIPDGPLLEMTPNGMHLDDATVALDAGAAGVLLGNKRELFEQILGSRARPKLWAIVAAPPSAPMCEMAPYLAAIRDHLGADVAIATVRPPATLGTRTLGAATPLAPRCCQVPISVASEGEPAAAYGTWGDLGRAAAERRALAGERPSEDDVLTVAP